MCINMHIRCIIWIGYSIYKVEPDTEPERQAIVTTSERQPLAAPSNYNTL